MHLAILRLAFVLAILDDRQSQNEELEAAGRLGIHDREDYLKAVTRAGADGCTACCCSQHWAVHILHHCEASVAAVEIELDCQNRAAGSSAASLSARRFELHVCGDT